MRLTISFFWLFLFTVSCSTHFSDNTNEMKNIAKRVQDRGGLTASPAKPDTVNVIGVWKTEGKKGQYLLDRSRDFAFRNQDVHVSFQYKNNIAAVRKYNAEHEFNGLGDYYHEMITSGRFDHDVIVTLNTYTAVTALNKDPHWGEKHLVDFSQIPGYFESQHELAIEEEDYRSEYDGLFLGPFIEGSIHIMFYNKALTDKMGFEVNTTGASFDEFRDYCRRIHQYNQTHGTHHAAIYDASDWKTIKNLFERVYLSNIGYSKNYQDPEGVFPEKNRQAFLNTLQDFESLAPYDPLIHSARTNKWYATRHLVLEDSAVFYFNGPWMPNNWEVIDAEKMVKMAPAEVPVSKPLPLYPTIYKQLFGVMKHSPRRDAGVRYVMDYCTKDAADDWIQYTKSPTGTKSSLGSGGSSGGDVFEQFISHIDNKYGRNRYYMRNYAYVWGTGFSYSWGQFEVVLHRILWGELSAEAVYEEVLNTIEAGRNG